MADLVLCSRRFASIVAVFITVYTPRRRKIILGRRKRGYFSEMSVKLKERETETIGNLFFTYLISIICTFLKNSVIIK